MTKRGNFIVQMQKKFFFILPILACISSVQSQETEGMSVVKNEAQKKTDIIINGKIFASYQWPDSIFKPILYPVFTSKGTEVTRGFPLHPRRGERVDHPHHAGIWLNYGNVNGIDFWGTSTSLPEKTRKKTGGIIEHIGIENVTNGKQQASMTTIESWKNFSGKELLAEKTRYEFIDKGDLRIIDRNTTLTATNDNVTMPDTKEGMFAIRVARQLELPSNEEVILTDASNNPASVKKMSNAEVTGSYKSSEEKVNDSVWGTRAKWVLLSGNIEKEKISIVICDHPSNPGYPTYWHARGYGLFAANPLGVKDFTNGKQTFDFSIPKGQSVTFRYRIIIASGKHLTHQEINVLANDFGKK